MREGGFSINCFLSGNIFHGKWPVFRRGTVEEEYGQKLMSRFAFSCTRSKKTGFGTDKCERDDEIKDDRALDQDWMVG